MPPVTSGGIEASEPYLTARLFLEDDYNMAAAKTAKKTAKKKSKTASIAARKPAVKGKSNKPARQGSSRSTSTPAPSLASDLASLRRRRFRA
jgi:hypothetical protein